MQIWKHCTVRRRGGLFLFLLSAGTSICRGGRGARSNPEGEVVIEGGFMKIKLFANLSRVDP